MYKFLCVIVAYLIGISVIFGFFVAEAENTKIDTLSSVGYSTNSVDFSGETDISKIFDYSFGGSNYCDLSNGNLTITPPIIGDVAVYFKGFQTGDNGYYDITYGINNLNSADFSLIISSQTQLTTPKQLLLRYHADTEYIDIIYSDSSIFAQTIAEDYYSDSINLNGEHKIRTEFNPVTYNLIITIDDIEICDIIIYDYSDESVIHYAGGIISDDFVIEYVTGDIYYSDEDISETNFLVIIGELLLFNVDEEYMPSILNIIFIKIPVFMLVIALGLWARGVA